MHYSKLIAAVAVTALAIGTSACSGSGSENSDSKEQTVDSTARAFLSDSVRKSGSLRVATYLGYPPFAYLEADGKTPTGAEIELMREAAKRLGLEAEFQDVGLAQLQLSVTNGKADAGANSLYDRPERRKSVDFIDYYKVTDSLVVRDGNPDKINRDDICGLTLSSSLGTAEIEFVNGMSDDCVKAGKKPIKQKIFKTSADGLQALASGRTDASLQVTPNARYQAPKTPLEVLGDPFEASATYVGVVVDKQNKEMSKALKAALDGMFKDGSALEILKKYKMDDGALPEPIMNAGPFKQDS